MKILPLNNYVYKSNKNTINQNQKLSVQSSRKNINELPYNNYHLSQISFTAKVQPSQLQEKCIEFGLDLMDKIKKDSNIDVFSEVKAFLNEYGINNVDMAPIKEILPPEVKISGLFQANYNDNLDYQGGTIYIDEVPKENDEKKIHAYASILAHELFHVLYFKDSNESLKNIFFSRGITEKADIACVMQKANKVASTIRNDLIATPLQLCYFNKEAIGFTNEDFEQRNLENKVYKASFPTKTSRKLDEQFICKVFGGEKKLESFIAQRMIDIFAGFKEEYNADRKMMSALNDVFIYQLRNEAQAYQVQSLINKKVQKLDKRFNSLSDVTIMFYNMLADKLGKIKQ